MKIWLDDVRSAPEGFTHHVHSLPELKELLEVLRPDTHIEAISFDHDLGENQPDGYEIVKWLAKYHLDRWPKEIAVHSANPVGAENIRQYAAQVRRILL